ncbi:MAG: hypothetical protein NT002_00835 [candidate division Zixibacteria bacterium]|nr:hypothetical protein [candidate division Zixibacteria bacterium]
MTPRKNHISYFLLLTLIFLCAATAATASYEGTVVTKRGQKYEKVQFDVNSIYKVVIIKLNGEKKNISFDQVEAIYDLNDNDISSEVLSGYKEPSRETWKSEGDPAFKRLNRRPWVMGFRFAGDFSIPAGSYYEGITSGIGLEGDFLVAVSREVAIKGTISKAGMKASKDLRFYSDDPSIEILSQELNYDAMRYLLGVQYYARPPQLAAGKGLFYSYISLGVISRKLSGKIYFRQGGDLYYGEPSDTETKFMTTFGIGGTILVSKHLGLDFGAEFDVVYLGSDDYGNIGRAYVIDFKVGLVGLY